MMLNVAQISTGYGKKQVLFDCSLQVGAGEVFLLVGGNGSGKSTLLRTIAGQLPVWNEGRICFDGEDITGVQTAGLLKRGLLYIPQSGNFFQQLTVRDNLEMAGFTIPDRKVLRTRLEEIVEEFPLIKDLLKRMPHQLSGGQQKLLTLAMAALHHPKMILFDEPFAGLSPSNIHLFVENFQRMHQRHNSSMLIVEHRVKESIPFVHRLAGMKAGRFVHESVIDDSFNIHQLNQIFV
jgi:branched-chain amino acid transport system ATP-binding protein